MPRPPDTDDATPVADLTYAAASEELDAIISEFESGVVDVDRLVTRLERATEIVDELDRRLRGTRMRVDELVPRLESATQDDGTLDDGGDPGPIDPGSDESLF
jgi:exodeoxyribonuclease VII small subunit